MTDNQTPESREDIEQLKESIAMAYRYRNEDDGMTFEEAEADLDKVITAATQASNKALLERLKAKKEEYAEDVTEVPGYPETKWIEAVPLSAIEAERQQGQA